MLTSVYNGNLFTNTQSNLSAIMQLLTKVNIIGNRSAIACLV